MSGKDKVVKSVDEDSLKYFNKVNRETFMDLKFVRGSTLQLNGSFPRSIFASDIDLYQRVDEEDFPEFRVFLDRLLEEESSWKPWKLKVFGVRKSVQTVEPLKLKPPSLKSEASHKSGWVKLNVMTFNGSYFEDTSIIWDFGDKMTAEEVSEALIKDIKELIEDENYLKAVKRLYSLTGGTDEGLREVLDDTELGFMNLTRTRIESLEVASRRGLFSREDRETVKMNLQQDLAIKLGIKSPLLKETGDSIDILLDDLDGRITERVKFLLKTRRIEK